MTPTFGQLWNAAVLLFPSDSFDLRVTASRDTTRKSAAAVEVRWLFVCSKPFRIIEEATPEALLARMRAIGAEAHPEEIGECSVPS